MKTRRSARKRGGSLIVFAVIGVTAILLPVRAASIFEDDFNSGTEPDRLLAVSCG